MQPAPIREPVIAAGNLASRIWIQWFTLLKDAIGSAITSSIRITVANSPYTVSDAGINLVCNTDGGAIIVNYPEGVQGVPIRVVNVGRSGNNVTLNGNGSELIDKGASKVLVDGAVYDSRFDTVEGWN